MRNVFKNSAEALHMWAAQSQDSGRAGNVFFNGRTAYSYGHHFPLGRIFPDVTDETGRTVVLMNSGSYSSTTARHQREASQAVRHLRQISVPNVDPRTLDDHRRNLDTLAHLIETLAGEHSRARKYGREAGIESTRRTLRDYAAAFSLGRIMTKRFKTYADEAVSFDDALAYALAAIGEENKRNAARDTARRKAEKKAAADRAAKLAAFERDELPAFIDAWRAGDETRRMFNGFEQAPSTVLSRYGGESGRYFVRLDTSGPEPVIETTGYARVTVTPDARRALGIAVALRRRALDTGKPACDDARTNVGAYRLDCAAADGSVVIGCHTFPADEAAHVIAALDLDAA